MTYQNTSGVRGPTTPPFQATPQAAPAGHPRSRRHLEAKRAKEKAAEEHYRANAKRLAALWSARARRVESLSPEAAALDLLTTAAAYRAGIVNWEDDDFYLDGKQESEKD